MTDWSRNVGGDGWAHPRTTPGRLYQVPGRTRPDCNAPVMRSAERVSGVLDAWLLRSEDVVPARLHRSVETEGIATRPVRAKSPVGPGRLLRDRVEQEAAAATRAHHPVPAPAAVQPQARDRSRREERAVVRRVLVLAGVEQ